MDFYDITQTFSTDEATKDYLTLVALEIEGMLLDLEEDTLAHELSIRDCEEKLSRTVDEFEIYRYTKTMELSKRRVILLESKTRMQKSMLARARTRRNLILEKNDAVK